MVRTFASSNAIGATGHTATNFTWTSGGTGTVVGAINDGVVAGVDAVAEALNIEETVQMVLLVVELLQPLATSSK